MPDLFLISVIVERPIPYFSAIDLHESPALIRFFTSGFRQTQHFPLSFPNVGHLFLNAGINITVIMCRLKVHPENNAIRLSEDFVWIIEYSDNWNSDNWTFTVFHILIQNDGTFTGAVSNASW